MKKMVVCLCIAVQYTDTCGTYGRCINLTGTLGYRCSCPLGKSGSRCEQGQLLYLLSGLACLLIAVSYSVTRIIVKYIDNMCYIYLTTTFSLSE